MNSDDNGYKAKKTFIDQLGWSVIHPSLIRYHSYESFKSMDFYHKLKEFYNEEEIQRLWNQAKRIYEIKNLNELSEIDD